jgi:murein DD-endopeptidase MepM/ murein hydrolase activator NlpD
MPEFFYPTLPMAKYSIQRGMGFLDPQYERFTGDLHSGADFNALTGGDSDLGHPIYAITDGVVDYAGFARGWGGLILIRHDGPKVWTLSAHNHKNLVRKNQKVHAGQLVATIGKGDATPRYPHGRFLAHLHFEVRLHGSDVIAPWFWASSALPRAAALEFIQKNYVDPLKFLKKMKASTRLPDD